MDNSAYKYFLRDLIYLLKDRINELENDNTINLSNDFYSGWIKSYHDIIDMSQKLAAKYNVSIDDNFIFNHSNKSNKDLFYKDLLRDLIYQIKETIECIRTRKLNSFEDGRLFGYETTLDLIKNHTIGFFQSLDDINFFDYEKDREQNRKRKTNKHKKKDCK